MTFNHINDVWDYLDNAESLKDLNVRMGNIPNKFGTFDIINEESWKEDGCIEIVNAYYDDNIGEMQEEYHTVDVESFNQETEDDE